MASRQLIALNQLDLVDLLRVDAHCGRLSDEQLKLIIPTPYHVDGMRAVLSRGE
ncbi:MAG: hypothetical protein ACI82Z_000104 [Cellvibrionaceae bacterium]|jgi:hypothetical protein